MARGISLTKKRMKAVRGNASSSSWFIDAALSDDFERISHERRRIAIASSATEGEISN
jgi:hypothetical protein